MIEHVQLNFVSFKLLTRAVQKDMFCRGKTNGVDNITSVPVDIGFLVRKQEIQLVECASF